jgi:hypothetical protein
MKRDLNQSRRSFITSTAGVATAVVAVGTSACQGGSKDRQLKFTSLAAAEDELAQLIKAEELVSSTTWNWAQTLMHCAQSIEYSMTGYPQTNSKLFQRTVGSAAFEAFSWRGRMTHDLAEPIPGVPLLDVKAEPARALERLRGAVLGFRQWSGLLKPHFAYGALSKEEYELAHAMHLANHFSAFHVKS